MLHKNQHDAIEKIQNIIDSKNLNSISFDDAITKTYFFHKLTLIAKTPIIYLDFDLLYSGYVASMILNKSDNVSVYQLTQESIKDTFVNLMDRISLEQHTVIIDSLNGFFAILDDQKESGRMVNSLVMLLVNAAQNTNSPVILGSISKFKKDEGWILSAIGRHVIEIDDMNTISIRKQNSQLQITQTDHLNTQKMSLSIFDLDLI